MDFLQKPDLFDLADTFPLLRDGHRAPGHVSPPGANLPTNKIAGASCDGGLTILAFLQDPEFWDQCKKSGTGP